MGATHHWDGLKVMGFYDHRLPSRKPGSLLDACWKRQTDRVAVFVQDQGFHNAVIPECAARKRV